MAQSKVVAKNKKTIVNEEIFGKTIDTKDPSKGISGTKIQANEIGNIPGVIEHWPQDIAIRKAEILEFSERSFIQKARGILSKNSFNGSVTGEELAQHHPIKSNAKLVSQLKANPKNHFARLQLVSSFLKSGREFPLEHYRTLLLQAMVACSMNELSTQGLDITIAAQNQYFLKLFNRCKDNLSKLKGSKNHGQADQIEELQRNMQILKLYQIHTNKLQKEGSKTDFMISHDEITNLYVAGITEFDDVEKAKKMLTSKLVAIIHILRYILLMNPVAHELLDLFIKMDQENPVGHFLKGRVYVSELIFSVSRYEGGERSSKTKQAIFDTFKLAYHHFGIAVKKIGRSPKGTTSFTMLTEYAQLIYYFYVISKSTLDIKLPKPWIESALTTAYKTLGLVAEPEKTNELSKKILSAMETEDCK